MDDHVHADRENVVAKCVGAQRRVAARIVGNGYRRYAAIGKGVASDADNGVDGTAAGLPAGHQLQGHDKMSGVRQVVLENAQHSALLFLSMGIVPSHRDYAVSTPVCNRSIFVTAFLQPKENDEGLSNIKPSNTGGRSDELLYPTAQV